MNVVKDILLITSIVAVLSTGECDNFHGSGIKRLKRHVVSIESKWPFVLPPALVPFNNSDDADGFYVFNLKLFGNLCDFHDSDCSKNNRTWVISHFKFQLHNKKDPCLKRAINFNPDKLSSIQTSINDKFSFHDGGVAIEWYWQRFGSCSLEIPELNDEFKFFKKGIELFDRFDIGQILRDKNITVKGDYPIDTISDAISNVLGGKRAQLGCIRGDSSMNALDGVAEFDEVIIFLDKQFNPIDDPGWKKNVFKNCPENITVHYGYNHFIDFQNV